VSPVVYTIFGKENESPERLLQKRGLSPHTPFFSLHQIHSDKAIEIHPSSPPQKTLQGDALFSVVDLNLKNRHSFALAVKTADCVPVLIQAEDQNKMIGIAAIHSGWRGTVQEISKKTLEALLKKFSHTSELSLKAWVGPSIQACCYEVGEDVAQKIQALKGEHFLTPSTRSPKRSTSHFMLDVPGLVCDHLSQFGIAEIERSLVCTQCSKEGYASFRRDADRRGTNWSLIALQFDQEN